MGDLLYAGKHELHTMFFPKSIAFVEAIISQRFHDILDYHSTTEDAGRTATRGRVKTLALNHCLPAPAPGTKEEWIVESARHFSGNILLSHDLLRITL